MEAEGEREAEGGMEAESEREATPTAKLNKKDSLALKGELGSKRRAWRGGREELRLPTYGWRA